MAHPTENLSAYISGELDPAERREVEAHVAGCRECELELRTLQKLNDLLSRQQSLDVSPQFGHRVLHQIEQREKPIGFRSRRGVALLAVAAAIAFFAFLISLRQKEEAHPPVAHQPPKIEEPQRLQPQPEAQRPDQKAAPLEDAELIAQLDSLENMDLIRNYEDLEDLDLAILIESTEESH